MKMPDALKCLLWVLSIMGCIFTSLAFVAEVCAWGFWPIVYLVAAIFLGLIAWLVWEEGVV